jgi:hypothetical protein
MLSIEALFGFLFAFSWFFNWRMIEFTDLEPGCVDAPLYLWMSCVYVYCSCVGGHSRGRAVSCPSVLWVLCTVLG